MSCVKLTRPTDFFLIAFFVCLFSAILLVIFFCIGKKIIMTSKIKMGSVNHHLLLVVIQIQKWSKGYSLLNNLPKTIVLDQEQFWHWGDISSIIILGVSVRVFLDEINALISRLGKADCPPLCGSVHPLGESLVRRNSFYLVKWVEFLSFFLTFRLRLKYQLCFSLKPTSSQTKTYTIRFLVLRSLDLYCN